MCALAYRQSIAAHKLAVDVDGTLLFFSKENFSNGSINTVDVFYPSAPLFLLMNTKLLRASVEPILQYASMSRWPWPYAPHDLGTYPLANGQTYGGAEQSERNQHVAAFLHPHLISLALLGAAVCLAIRQRVSAQIVRSVGPWPAAHQCILQDRFHRRAQELRVHEQEQRRARIEHVNRIDRAVAEILLGKEQDRSITIDV